MNNRQTMCSVWFSCMRRESGSVTSLRDVLDEIFYIIIGMQMARSSFHPATEGTGGLCV